MKRIIAKTGIYDVLRHYHWERKGKYVHAVKQRTLELYAKKFNLKVFIETGTYYGDMVAAMKDIFDQLYSIELSKELHEKAVKRFKEIRKIKIIHGDSGVELGNLLKEIDKPALFWLDGHYSGGITAKGDQESPIYEELNHILSKSRKDVIVIDDASCFGRDPAYPSIADLSKFITSKKPDTEINIQDDFIIVTPR